jgi:hypothetical protein
MSGGRGKVRHDSDDAEARKQLYAQQRDELVNKQNSNSERYDSAILTLSSAGLGLSISFIKDVVPFKNTWNPWLLIISWALFGLAIVCTMLSFQASQRAIQTNLKHAEQYYLNRKDEYLSRANCWISVTNWLNRGSGGFFVAAIVCTAVFVSVNLLHQLHEPKIDTEKVNPAGHRIDTVIARPR